MGKRFKKVKLPRLLSEDFFRKFVAFFFAVLIWFSIHQEVTKTTTVTRIPVRVRVMNDLHVIPKEMSEITVTVSGPEEELKELNPSKIQVEVDLPSELKQGLHKIAILDKNIKLPGNLRVVDKSPGSVSVDVDIMEKKFVEVRPVFNRSLAGDYSMSNYTIQPERVYIKGPSRRLKEIHRVMTETIEVDSTRTEDFVTPADIAIPRETVIDYPKVTVSVDIKLRKETRSISELLPVSVLTSPNGNLDPAYRVRDKVNLNIKAPSELIDNLKPELDYYLFVVVGEEEQPHKDYEVKFWCRHPEVSAEYIYPKKLSLFKETK